MVKTTFDDLRKHAWSGKTTEEDFSKLAEEKADERIENLRDDISKEIEATISELARKTQKTDAEISKIKASMKKIVGKAITESRRVEKDVELENLKRRILSRLRFLQSGRKRTSIVFLHRILGSPSIEIYEKALRSLEGDNLISLFLAHEDRVSKHDKVSLTDTESS
jgi:vacuolar-type H+-ATPase subunit H